MNLIDPTADESEDDKQARLLDEYLATQADDARPELEEAPEPDPVEEAAPAAAPAQAAPPTAQTEPHWAEKYRDMGYGAGAPATTKMDSKGALWAGMADLLLNKGRNLGGILVEANTPRAVPKGQDPLDRELKIAQIDKLRTPGHRDELAAQRLALQKETQKRLAESQALRMRRARPDSPESMALQELAIANGAPEEQVRGQSYDSITSNRQFMQHYVEHAAAPVKAQDAAAQTGMTTQARLDTEHVNAPRTAEDAAVQTGMTARAGTAARIGTEGELAPTSANTATVIQEGKAEAELGRNKREAGISIPGLVVTSLEAYTQWNMTPGAREKLANASDDLQVMDASVAGAREILDGAGVWARALPGEKQAKYDEFQGQYIGKQSKLLSTGVINNTEWQRYETRFPKLQFTGRDIIDAATGEPVKAQQLAGIQAAFRQAAAAGLTSKGVQPDWGASARASAVAGHGAGAPPAPPAPPGSVRGRQGLSPAGPTGVGGHERLPVTGAKSTALRNPDGSWVITEPGQEPKRVPSLSPGALAKLKGAPNWTVSE